MGEGAHRKDASGARSLAACRRPIPRHRNPHLVPAQGPPEEGLGNLYGVDAVETNALAATIGEAVGDIEYLAVGAGGITPGRIEHVPGVGERADENGQHGRQRQPRNHHEDEEADEEKRGCTQRGRHKGTGDRNFGHEGRFFSRRGGCWGAGRVGGGCVEVSVRGRCGSAVDAGEDVLAQGFGVGLFEVRDFDDG